MMNCVKNVRAMTRDELIEETYRYRSWIKDAAIVYFRSLSNGMYIKGLRC